MRWGIRNQILLPFAVVLLAAVALTAFSAAYLAAERSEREIADRQIRVMETLGRSNFPYRQNVLQMMRGLSGAEFAAVDESGEVAATTLPEKPDAADLSSVEATSAETLPPLGQQPLIELRGSRYLAAGYRRMGPRGREETLYVLYPETQLRAARREAALPPLIVGSVTLVALVIVSAWLAVRFGGRIRRVQEQVTRIAEGEFLEMPLGTTRDEILELVKSINQMATKLRGLQDTIERTERSRLLGQLAGGLAHQLRNAVTGARLAIQLHQRRCESDDDRASLDVALRQLTLTEEHVRSLLSVGRPERRDPVKCPLGDLLDDVAALVSPVCRHENVALSQERLSAGEDSPPHAFVVRDSDAVRTAVLNLVLNAVDAAGPGGEVTVRVKAENQTAAIEVLDNGPGPPPELNGRLFEPFVTGKTEGVGLGLALVKQVADDVGGEVAWERVDGRTLFCLQVPVEVDGASEASESGAEPLAVANGH